MRNRTARLGAALAMLAAGMALSAPTATASVSCSYDPGTGGSTTGDEVVTVSMNAGGDVAAFTVAGGEIMVNGLDLCGPATTANTANIRVDDLSDSPAGTSVEIAQPATFAPGTGSDEDAVPEIEFLLFSDTEGADLLQLRGDTTPNGFVVGAAGVNFNQGPSDSDNDINFVTGTFRRIELTGGQDADLLSGQGGGGTLGPFASGTVKIDGKVGNDTIEGGNGGLASSGDDLEGSAGNDTMRGFGGKDILHQGPGDDNLDCGAGPEDTLDYTNVQGGVTIDLAASAPQTNGPIGSDTIVGGCEVVLGTGQGDRLSGTGATEDLQGRGGGDVLNGRGAADGLSGDAGTDAVTYADTPAGVTVDLGAGTATGGAGNDFLTDVENAIGSPFGDSLTGSAIGNSITGLGGTDTISALAGPDSVDVRDGVPDTASCGADADTAIADQAGVDTIDADCETVAFPPEPPGGGDGGNGTADADVSFDLTGKARQRVVKQGGVVAKASCPLEDCTAIAGGTAKVPKPKRSPLAKFNLRPVTEQVSAGVTEKVELPIAKRRLRAVKAALRAGKKPMIKVTASVTDAAGNAATDSLVVTARR